ncbi:MAG: DUF11 domain-containing protein [Candidatus Omnitrophica bacterium]|nr:DUF11 domain-containing protein [Candidatus Omnitrophota bacterium]
MVDNMGDLVFTAYQNSEGETTPTNVTVMNITRDGIVTISTLPSFYGMMNQNRDTIVFTVGEGVDKYKIGVIQQTGRIFSATDLQGMWAFHTLASGKNAQWQYGTVIIDNSGKLEFTACLNSEGETTLPDAEVMNISSDGTITVSTEMSFHGIMNENKDMIVFTIGRIDSNNRQMGIITRLGKNELSEKSSTQSNIIETLRGQQAELRNVSVSGDFNTTLDFTKFEMVTITTGSFAGKGFSKGEFGTNIANTSCSGKWQGMVFFKPEEKTIYLKGSVSGGISAAVEGTLTESVQGNGIYDKYQATWKINRIDNVITSATIELEGILVYTDSLEYPGTKLSLLQTNLEGTISGNYAGSLDTVLTQVRIIDEYSSYLGEGFSYITYTSESGTGEIWTYDKLNSSGIGELIGLSDYPFFGITYATLDESNIQRILSVIISGVDLGCAPVPDLKVKIWGPEKVSPGETVNYIIEYRNDGLKDAAEAIVYNYPDPVVNYLSASEGVYYDPYPHQVSWNLGALPAKSVGYLNVQAEISWGLPAHLSLENRAYIEDIVLHSTKENGFGNGICYNSGNKNEKRKYEKFISFNNAEWIVLYDKTNLITGPLEAYLASKDVRTSRNGVGEDGSSIFGPLISGERSNWISYSGGTTTAVNQAKKGRISSGTLYLISPQLVTQKDLETISSSFDKIVVYQGDDLMPDKGIEGFIINIGLLVLDIDGDGKASKDEIINWGKSLKPSDDKIGDLITKIEKSEDNKVLDSFEIYPKEPGNQIKMNWNDNSSTEFRITYDLHPEGNIVVLTLPGIKHDEWIPVLNKFNNKYKRLPGQDDLDKLKEVFKKFRNKLSSIFSQENITAHDPNEKLVSPAGDVMPGEKLTYTLSYENEGEGKAFGVYITDTLDEDLDENTLVINNNGYYNSKTRTISWFIGKLESKEKGSVNFDINVRQDARDKSEVINFAIVYFPSVPESTRTNGTVNRITTMVDNIAPVTIIATTPFANSAGWNNTDVSISLSATDNEEGSGVKELHYKLTGATQEEKIILTNTAQTAITTEGTTALTYWAIDNAGNAEAAKSLEINVDKTPPSVNVIATPDTLWPPNHKLVDVTINGLADDGLSGIVSTTFKVEDEYHNVEPNISDFGTTIRLEAWRRGDDLDGRNYIVSVTAKDKAGNESSAATVVICPHDQGKK